MIPETPANRRPISATLLTLVLCTAMLALSWTRAWSALHLVMEHHLPSLVASSLPALGEETPSETGHAHHEGHHPHSAADHQVVLAPCDIPVTETALPEFFWLSLPAPVYTAERPGHAIPSPLRMRGPPSVRFATS